MFVVAQAITTLFAATSGAPPVHNSFYTSVGGRLYNTQAPQNTKFPYATFSFVAGTPDWMFRENLENLLIQFSLFSATGSSNQEIETIYEYMKDLFDWAPLNVSGYTTLWMRRETDHGLTCDDFNIWTHPIDYRLYLLET
jgi:hypothetical protein